MAHVHLVGIGGSGLSAIARLLLESGQVVSGSDRQLSPLAADLQTAGAQVFIGHRPENVAGADLVVRSSAIPDDNPEVLAARSAGIPVLKRGDFLGQLLENRTGIAVAGTHGKTTTTAMIAWVLTELGQEPAYLIGGVSKNLGTNARAGRGEAFVIEADEYDHMFLGLRPKIAVVTNVEHDHPDCYPTAEDFQRAFEEFAGRLAEGGILLGCSDDRGAAQLLETAAGWGQRALAYGLDEPSNRASRYSGRNLQPNPRGGFDFEVAWEDQFLARLRLQVPGRHNTRNALATLAVAHLLELSLERAAEALSEFEGTGRRFEVRGEPGGVTVIDDYAHHPTEVRATLAAARARYPKRRLWAVWQPHTYSRTRLLFDEFTHAFTDADRVVVTEVYPAREPVQKDFSSNQVAAAMEHPAVYFAPDLQAASEYLLDRLQPGDVLLVLSAGDADWISAEIVRRLSRGGRLEDARREEYETHL